MNKTILSLSLSSNNYAPLFQPAPSTLKQSYTLASLNLHHFTNTAFLSTNTNHDLSVTKSRFSYFLSSVATVQGESFTKQTYSEYVDLNNSVDLTFEFSECTFKKITANINETAGCFTFVKDKTEATLLVKECHFIQCTAENNGAFLFNGVSSTVTNICAMGCHIRNQNHVFHSICKNGDNFFKESHFSACAAFQVQSPGCTCFRIEQSNVLIEDVNVTNSRSTGPRAAGSVMMAQRFKMQYFNAQNITGRTIFDYRMGESATDQGIIEDCMWSHFKGISHDSVAFFNHLGQFIVQENDFARIPLSKYVFSVPLDSERKSIMTVRNCFFEVRQEAMLRSDGVVFTSSCRFGNQADIVQIEEKYNRWACATEATPSKSPTQSPVATQSPTPSMTPLPTFFIPKLVEPHDPGQEEYDENGDLIVGTNNEMSAGDWIQIIVLIILIAAAFGLYLAANKKKKQNLAEKESFLLPGL